MAAAMGMVGDMASAGEISQGAGEAGAGGAAMNAATAAFDAQQEEQETIGKVLNELDQMIKALINDIG